MKSTAILVIVILLSIVWIVTNIMIAIGLIGGRKDEILKSFSGEDKTLTELHRRVEELKNNKEE